jgi:8-oxo-dGTP pyrophosphatase MutT (NUDIX family)
MRTIHREIVGGFIFSNDGHILLGRSQPGGVYQGYNTIPGGGVDEGETLAEALKREILEETGLDIQDAKIELVNDEQSGESEKILRDTGERVLAHMHFNDFRVTMPTSANDLTLQEGDDFASPEWIPVSELSELKLTEPTKITLGKLGLL